MKEYGILGANFIHLHHLLELDADRVDYKIHPARSLVPMYPDCLTMLHQRIPCYSIDELKNIRKANSDMAL